MWFSQGCTIGCDCTGGTGKMNFVNFTHFCDSPQKPTLPAAFRTFNVNNTDAYGDWTQWHPWRAPGTAKPLDACGLSGGSTKDNDAAGGFGNDTVAHKQGAKGSQLPPVAAKTTWTAGTEVEVSFGIAANHGGGYLYRLCPKGSPLTEECFMARPLAFAGDTSTLRWSDGHEVTIPARRVNTGTMPKGVAWTMNPIPACDDVSGGYKNAGCARAQFPPPKGCDASCWGYQPCPTCATKEMPAIVDKVSIPADLPPGEYVVGWRWDCEQTAQVWSGCGDVTVVAPPSQPEPALPEFPFFEESKLSKLKMHEGDVTFAPVEESYRFDAATGEHSQLFRSQAMPLSNGETIFTHPQHTPIVMPPGPIALRSFKAEVVDANNVSVPLSEVHVDDCAECVYMLIDAGSGVLNVHFPAALCMPGTTTIGSFSAPSPTPACATGSATCSAWGPRAATRRVCTARRTALCSKATRASAATSTCSTRKTSRASRTASNAAGALKRGARRNKRAVSRAARPGRSVR